MGYILEAWKQLEEDVLLEGKNLEKTLDIYTPKFLDAEALYDSNEEETKEYIKHLISLDPTYKEGSNFTGDYGVWILDKYLKYHNQNKIDVFDRYDITQLLNDFINVKQSLPNKDIGSYKTLEDLLDAIYSVELTDRQKERRLRKSKDYHIVYKDDDWTVYVPDTYAGSCTLGKGTSWCTAYSENDEYYQEYTKQGPLYIIINNNDKSEKYQFHYPSEQFMDKDDEEIDRYGFFEQNKSLYKFFIEQGLEIDPSKPFIYDRKKRVPQNVVTVIVSDLVDYIGDDVFSYCTSLKSIDIPNSVKWIGNFAFTACKSLQSITIPSSVKEIGDYAFSGCDSLKSVIIPDSVEYIGYSAFYNCLSLKSANIPNSVEKIVGVFNACESLQSITIPNSVKEIGSDAFSWCTSLKSINIPDSVERISNYAFSNCKSLKSVIIPDSVEYIGSNVFWLCKSLQYAIVKKDSIAHRYMTQEYPEVKLIFKDV